MRLRFKLGLIAAVLLGVFLEGRSCGKPKPKSPAVLPSNDVEQIRVDPSTHRLIVLTPHGTQTVTLPDRVSTIDVRKDGSVKVTASQMGFETHPFVGLGYGQGTRLYFGADLGYYKKANLGLGISTPDLFDKSNQKFNDVRVGAFASYTVRGNMRVTLGYDMRKTAHFLISVRIF